MKKKILGTGLRGLVGSRIVELLKDKFDFEDLAIEEGFDITKKETIEQKIAGSSAESLIHLAAFTDVNAAWKEKDDLNGSCYRINVLGTKNIAGLCQKYNKFLVHFSTDFVFNGEKDGCYSEDETPRPIEWYGETKYQAEEAVKNLSLGFCIARIAFPFRTAYLPKLDLIRKIIEGLKNKTLYPQFSDQIITPTFVDDIAFGVEKIIEKQAEGIFHLTGSTPISPFNLAQKVAETFGFDKNLVLEGSLTEFIKENPTSRPYQKNLCLSNKKTVEYLKIKMRSLDEAFLELSRAGFSR